MNSPAYESVNVASDACSNSFVMYMMTMHDANVELYSQ